jgi:CHAD domain-containing protein
MKNKGALNLNTKEQIKKIHDLRASIRFLENLYKEISIATNLTDLQDPIVLKKFDEIIKILKKETKT